MCGFDGVRRSGVLFCWNWVGGCFEGRLGICERRRWLIEEGFRGRESLPVLNNIYKFMIYLIGILEQKVKVEIVLVLHYRDKPLTLTNK